MNGNLDARFARDVRQLHGLGWRATAELLAQIGAEHLIQHPIEMRVREYIERLDRTTLDALGANDFASRPHLRLVVGEGGQ